MNFIFLAVAIIGKKTSKECRPTKSALTFTYPPPPTAFSADQTAAPTGFHSPVATPLSPPGKCRCRYLPVSPPGLSCWSTDAGAIPAPGRVTGQHGVHSH